jgi:hypothetical protein
LSGGRGVVILMRISTIERGLLQIRDQGSRAGRKRSSTRQRLKRRPQLEEHKGALLGERPYLPRGLRSLRSQLASPTALESTQGKDSSSDRR